MSSTLSSPCEACGWAAAAASAIAFGSFGVPIRGATIALDPLVFQSYKTIVCFMTSWLVLLWGNEFVFSPWGIVSGIFWVPGGVATVYAIQAAGLAVGIGIGSSFIVLVSFVWGIFVFGEQVHSRVWATFAIVCMMAGLLGMSFFASPQDCNHQNHVPVGNHDLSLEVSCSHLEGHVTSSASSGGAHHLPESDHSRSPVVPNEEPNDDMELTASTVPTETYSMELIASQERETDGYMMRVEPDTVIILGRRVSRRHAGMLAAMFTGCYGGSIMVPMQYTPSNAKGINFLISFAVGSAVVNSILWILRFAYCFYRSKSLATACDLLPSFHINKMFVPGLMCGLLWSLGNFFSLISIFYLGEGVGYPLVQTSILVSGLWGIFYFGEICGESRVAWLTSSVLTVLGILLLSYEHHRA